MKVEVTGSKIREAIRTSKKTTEMLVEQFRENTTYFATVGVDAPNLEVLGNELYEAYCVSEELQMIQDSYNTMVLVGTPRPVPLNRCIKGVGNAATLEKLWRQAATALRRERGYGVQSMRADEVMPKLSVPAKLCVELSAKYATIASTYRQMLAEGNMKVIEFYVSPEAARLLK
jgi:hypothetical protein